MLSIEKYINYPPDREEIGWEMMKIKIRERLINKAERRNRYQRVKMIEFKKGQHVLVRQNWISDKMKKRSAKLSPLFTGPVEIRKRLGLNTYLIKMKKKSNKCRVHNIVNLYPYISRKERVEEHNVLGNARTLEDTRILE